jgi:histidinol phosphatase-like PHP family hydrolase
MMATATRSDSIFQSRYLFHFHTLATDGKLKVADYFRFAREHAFDKLIFLEHIRRSPTYDVDAFITEVKEASQEFGIQALAGFEAKLLPDGMLDIDESYGRDAEVLGIAEHGFAGDVVTLSGALTECFQRYEHLKPRQALVWVHPGLFLKKNGLLKDEQPRYRDLLDRAIEAGVPPERNMRYDLVPQPIFSELDPDCRVIGADAHSNEDLARYLNWQPC